MIRISKMADYAVVVLSILMRTDGALMAAPALAAGSGLPEPTVSKLMKLLAAQGLVESVRGAGGGYRLMRAPAELSMAEVISAVDGPIGLTACVEGAQSSCDYQEKCPVRGRWDNVNRAVRDALSSVSLVDMASPCCAAPTTKEKVNEQHL